MTTPFDIETSPITEPESVVIDTFVQWRKLVDYDDAVYDLYYEVRDEAHNQNVRFTGTYDASNEWWVFSVGSGDYDHLHAGDNRWDLILERLSDGERAILATGTVLVHADSSDRRTHAEIMVAKIESILRGRADHDVESYSIKNRSITRMSVKELTEWRDYYVSEVARTGGSATGAARPKQNTVRVRFV